MSDSPNCISQRFIGLGRANLLRRFNEAFELGLFVGLGW
jgi:hypothetical protein